MLKVLIISDLRAASCVSNIGNLFSGLYKRRSTVRRVSKASSDAGPELAGRESHCGDGKPVGPDRSLETGVWWGINKSSSDDRPGSCICGSKYVEDAKAARSVFIRASSDAGRRTAKR